MFKDTFKGLALLLALLLVYGCTSTKDVEVRRYVEVKDRVDQNMEIGNSGYIAGDPIPEDRSDIRMTRKIYVVEVSKTGEIEDETVIVDDPDAYQAGYNGTMEEEPENVIRVPRDAKPIYDYYDPETDADLDTPASGSLSFTEYTIQKDDTLQKISKKFYDSYSKWPKIYDANRDVLDNPDTIKPGIVIKIPSL